MFASISCLHFLQLACDAGHVLWCSGNLLTVSAAVWSQACIHGAASLVPPQSPVIISSMYSQGADRAVRASRFPAVA